MPYTPGAHQKFSGVSQPTINDRLAHCSWPHEVTRVTLASMRTAYAVVCLLLGSTVILFQCVAAWNAAKASTAGKALKEAADKVKRAASEVKRAAETIAATGNSVQGRTAEHTASLRPETRNAEDAGSDASKAGSDAEKAGEAVAAVNAFGVMDTIAKVLPFGMLGFFLILLGGYLMGWVNFTLGVSTAK